MMVQQFRTKLRNRSRGQTMVEFALAFPIFLVLVIGIMEFGRLFITYTSVYAAAREGARYGAAVDNLINDTCFQQIEVEAERAGFIAGDMTVDIRYEIYDIENGQWISGTCEAAKAGDRVIVTASVPFTFVTGFMPGSSPLTISSTAKRTIIKDVRLRWDVAAPASPTNPPGPDETPSEEITPTDTVLPTCNDQSIYVYSSSASPYTVTLFNSTGDIFDLTSITVFWKKPNTDLINITLSGEEDGWSGEVEKSPAYIDLISEELDWQINGELENLIIIFNPTDKDVMLQGVQLTMINQNTGLECQIP